MTAGSSAQGTRTWSSVNGTNPSGRIAAVASPSSLNSGVLLFGVSQSDGLFGETWIFDTDGWSQVFLADNPPSRVNSMLCQADPQGGLLLFGGFGWLEDFGSTSPLNDSWSWSGSKWLPMLVDGPTPRSCASMAYHSTMNLIVLFGGDPSVPQTSPLGDTWIYADGVWTSGTLTQSPSPRFGGAITFDENLDRILLFGGAQVEMLSDTWAFDGSSWEQIDTLHTPPARANAGLAFHPGLGGSLLFGGLGVPAGSGSSALNDAWLFDGTDWNPFLTNSPPPPAAPSAFAYSSDLSYLVMYSTTGGKVRSGPRQYSVEPFTGATWTLP